MSVCNTAWPRQLGAMLVGVGIALLGEVSVLASTPPVQPPSPQDAASADDGGALDEVRALVQARAPQHPFDRASLHVRAAVSAADELRSLRDELSAASADLGAKGSKAWDRSADISERLALFPVRFSVEPRQVAGWDDLSAEAARILEAADGPAPTIVLSERDSHAQLFRALLSDLAGRTLDGQKIREGFVQQPGCGNCTGAREAVRGQRRSEAAERNGAPKLALELLLQVASDPYGSHGYFLDQAQDISCARLGMLLIEQERVADGVAVLQMVVDLRDGTPGAEVARAALEQLGALIEPTADRIESIYVRRIRDPKDGWQDARWGLGLMALARFPADGAFSRLSGIWSRADQEYYRGHAPLEALVLLQDERARALFEQVARHGSLMILEIALRGLDGLQGGADASIVPALQRIAASNKPDGLYLRADLDAWLRAHFHGGPDPSVESLQDARTSDEVFAKAWLRWIEQQDAPAPR